MHVTSLPLKRNSLPFEHTVPLGRPSVDCVGPAAGLGQKKRSFWSLVQQKAGMLLAATLVFNLIDAVLTLALVSSGLAVEANPIMAFFLEVGPLTFMAAKIALVSLGVGVLWHFKRYQLALVGTLAVFGIYTTLLAYHGRSVMVLIQHGL